MGVKSCTVNEKDKTLTVVMDLETPRPSKSGRTMVVASTSGNKATEAKYKGNNITIGVNAYYKDK